MTVYGQYPKTRLRRLRSKAFVRDLVREHQLSVKDLIWPLFVCEGEAVQQPIASLPNVSRLSIDNIVKAAQQADSLGIPMIALFPATPAALKTDDGREATNPDNLVCRAIRALKSAQLNVGIMADVALDPYTTHGHDGVIINGEIANDATVEVLVEQAKTLAHAGADVIAPSDMQDGRVGAIRAMLESEALHHTLILSYAAKFASKFYGPFRDAVGSKANLSLSGQGKHTYQQDPANAEEALREVALDLKEGADMVMVKPGMPYLDVIYRVKSTFQVPTFAYQVSGEYAMLQAAIQNNWLDKAVWTETLMAFKRAGADGVLTYAACEIAEAISI